MQHHNLIFSPRLCSSSHVETLYLRIRWSLESGRLFLIQDEILSDAKDFFGKIHMTCNDENLY